MTSALSAPFQLHYPQCPQNACTRSTCSRTGPYKPMQSTSRAFSTHTHDRACHTSRQWSLSTLTAWTPMNPNAPSRSGLIEWSMPVGIVLLPATRASSGRSVQWLSHMGRDVARHTFRCARDRRSTTCRPSTLLQRRHHTRSRVGHGSPSAPAAE